MWIAKRFQKDVKSIRLRPRQGQRNTWYVFQKDVKSIRLRPKRKARKMQF